RKPTRRRTGEMPRRTGEKRPGWLASGVGTAYNRVSTAVPPTPEVRVAALLAVSRASCNAIHRTVRSGVVQAKLEVVAGDETARQFDLQLPVIIGRSRSTDVHLGHPLISRHHCELFE